MTQNASIEALKQKIVDGLAVLTGEGCMDGSGHLSVRIPGTDTFLINPRFAGALADVEDICTVDIKECKRLEGIGPIPSETHIHAAVYRHRPDVTSVVHCHPRHAVLVGALESGFVPCTREGRGFAEGVPVFPVSRNIDTPALGERMVHSLADFPALFLRGHGIVATGPSIEGTCVSTINLENACRDQLLLMSFTTPKPLEDLDAGRMADRMENPYRAWPFFLYKHKVQSREQIKANLKPLPEGERY